MTIALAMSPAGVRAQIPSDGGAGPSSQLAPPAPRLAAVRVVSAPLLDGRLDEAIWFSAPGTSAFVQQQPYEGSPPSEHTTMRVIYDEDSLYLGFDCEQTRTPITGRLTRRDEDSESDWVWVYIDSRRDGRTAYFFAVNVHGVMADGLMHEGGGGSSVNLDWDDNWEARSALTAHGWSAEIRIPLRVLRFTPGLAVQDWGLWATRFIAASQEKDDWPQISREIAAPIPFFGRLDDLRQLAPAGVAEIRPFALGQVRYRNANDAIVNHGLDGAPSGGVDLKLRLTQSLILDAAVNPDFAQVESDQLILNLNNYEIQFPEKRPLFIEGADMFTTPLQIFYSRRIGSSPPTPIPRAANPGEQPRLVDIPGAAAIYGALKLSGRFQNGWSVGLLSALASRREYDIQNYDAQTMPVGVPMRHTVEPLTAFNVLRIRREIGERAQIGVIATAATRFEQSGGERICPAGQTVPTGTRCFRDTTAGGVDVNWRSPTSQYAASAQLVGSVVRQGLPDVQLDGTSIESGNGGLGGWARLAKEGGRHLLAEVAYTGIGRRLTYNDLGFMPRQNLHEGKMGVELRSLVPGPLTLERHLRLDLLARRDLGGLDLGMLAELGFTVRLKSFWILHFAADFAPSRFDDREVGDGAALERASYAGGKADVISDPRARWGVGLKGEVRFLAGGTWMEAQVPLVIRAWPQLTIEVTPQISLSSGEQRFAWHASENLAPSSLDPQYVFGRLLARSAGATTRFSYTFTPRLSLQVFGQLFLAAEHYGDFRQIPRMPFSRVRLSDLRPLTSVQAPTDADFEQAALNLNVVLRWEYRLGSTLFLVYSRSQVPEVALGASEAALRLSAIGSAPAVHVALLKLSFWWAP